MAEHEVEEVIGLSLDGTGYGLDGRVWGGEVLLVRAHGASFERFAHLAYVPMPGADAAVKEPWRMTFGHLYAAGMDVTDAFVLERLGIDEQTARVVQRMMERGVNAPLTSSCGRLFDAVAALVLGRRAVDYEAQAAIELEGIAVDEDDAARGEAYTPTLGDDGAMRMDSLWHAVVNGLKRGVAPEQIAARFHAGVAQGFVAAAVSARAKTGIKSVAMSGGCMHNRRLVRLLRAGLEAEGFRVVQHREVSPGDGGLSYGQAVVAAAMLLAEKN